MRRPKVELARDGPSRNGYQIRQVRIAGSKFSKFCSVPGRRAKVSRAERREKNKGPVYRSRRRISMKSSKTFSAASTQSSRETAELKLRARLWESLHQVCLDLLCPFAVEETLSSDLGVIGTKIWRDWLSLSAQATEIEMWRWTVGSGRNARIWSTDSISRAEQPIGLAPTKIENSMLALNLLSRTVPPHLI